MDRYDVQVRGAGIVGQALALTLARQGLRIALVAQKDRAERGADLRAYALNAPAIELLRSLKVWDALPAAGRTAVYDMRVEGDIPGAAIEFSAYDQRVGELAWIVDAAALEGELASAVRFAPHIQVVVEPVPAALTALCEGRESSTRELLGVTFERHDYAQRAIAARLIASKPHAHVAHQWFRSPDVLALLPFDTPSPGCSYALVWSLPQERADELLALDDAAFEAQLMQASGGTAGELKLSSSRGAWPLMRAQASAWCGPGWVLLGDAAHVVHPLAGQGLNLGLADVTSLARVIAEREPWRALGDEKLLRRYVRERASPTWAMGQMTEGLLMLFAQNAAPLKELRNRGLTLVNRLSPLKRWLAQQALR